MQGPGHGHSRRDGICTLRDLDIVHQMGAVSRCRPQEGSGSVGDRMECIGSGLVRAVGVFLGAGRMGPHHCTKAWAEVDICVMDNEVHGFRGNEKGFVIEVTPEPGVGEEGLDVNIVVWVCPWHHEPLVLENTHLLCSVMVHIGMQEHPYRWICLPNL